MTDRCEIARCRNVADVTYLGHGVCSAHWDQFTNENASPDALRVVLGIAATHEPMETDMSKKSVKTETKAKPEKAAKKSEPKQKVPMRTVALRVDESDFQLLHKAAGERNLSKFMKTTLIAAANKAVSK